jgi:glycosyltransferase involved in cell wall biosynthesis
MNLSQSHNVKLITRGSQPQNEEILEAVSDVYLSPSAEQSNYIDHFIYYLHTIHILIFIYFQGELDAVHTFPGPSTHLGVCCKFAFDIVWVVDILDDPSVERNSLQEKRPIVKYVAYSLHIYLAKRDLRFADRVIVVGWSVEEGLPSIVAEQYNVSDKRIFPVPNGVDLDGTKPADIIAAPSTKEFIFFYVGSIKKVRGIDVLVRAFADFNESVPNSRLEILGPVRQQQDEKALTDLLRELDISESVCFPATRVDHDEVLERMARADVCVLPLSGDIDNYKYTFPIKLFEYLAMSKPVVATRLDGISRVIQDEQNGLLVEPGNSEDMSWAFKRFYQNEQLRDTCAENARDSIRQYDWTEINRSVGRMYDEIIEEKT